MKNDMKKALFFLFSIVLLCSCRGPQGPQGPQGPAGEGVNWKITDVSVTQWDYTNYSNNNYFFAKFNVPALTSFVFTDGNVQCYIYLNENGQTIQHSLPYTLPMEIVENNGDVYFYTRTVDFVYGVGWVQFEVRDSDFAYEIDTQIVPDKMDFRIVMTY